MKLHLKVWRQAGPDAAGAFSEYDVDDAYEAMTLLELLDRLNDRLIEAGEEPIAFESDCREGICGCCGMNVNGRPHGPKKNTPSCHQHLSSFKDGDTITLEANTAERVLAILDVLESKLFRRGVSLKALDLGDKEPRPSGKIYRLACPLREGLTQEVAKKITKAIRDEGPKSVKATIQGDEVRVTSKSRDDLQTVIALLKNLDVDAALQFVNYR